MDISRNARSLTITEEDGYLLGNDLANMQVETVGGVTIYSGTHSEYGSVHIVVPSVGGNAKVLLSF